MNRKLAAALVLLLQLLALPAVAASFEVGQVWRYNTRPGEEASRLYIAHIDRDLATRTIFHLYIDGLKLQNPLMAGGVQDHLTHVPVSRETLEASVTELQQENVLPPDISEGYVLWREAFEKGQAGVFTVPVAQIVGIIEQAFAKQGQPQSAPQ